MKKSRKSALILALCMLCVFAGTLFAGGVEAKNTIDGQFSFELVVVDDDHLDIGIRLTSDSDVTNGSFNFCYDREALEFVSENEKTKHMEKAFVQFNNDYTDDEENKVLRVSFASAYPLPEGTGVVFSAKFKLLKTGATELSIKNGKLYLHNEKLDKYLPEDFTAQVFLNSYTETLDPAPACKYEVDDHYIKAVKVGTKVKELKDGFLNKNLKVCDLNGNEKGDNDLVGTGFTVCIVTTNGECTTGIAYATVVILRYKVVIPCDLDGNSKIDSTDTILLKRHMLGIASLSDAAFEAADSDSNAKIDSTDYIYMKRVLLGIIK